MSEEFARLSEEFARLSEEIARFGVCVYFLRSFPELFYFWVSIFPNLLTT
ncbi:hypothetical protein GCM10009001_28800 [Virgibacillus siamensis]|uniref:Uncharacterized protein n=1 Tax=Virgibacillus siamensis TaxID=480071 RepID=A0ABP3RL46_9BACI